MSSSPAPIKVQTVIQTTLLYAAKSGAYQSGFTIPRKLGTLALTLLPKYHSLILWINLLMFFKRNSLLRKMETLRTVQP